MRVAVIGAGVAGLGAAWAMRNTHDVTLFEAQPRFGGHANTVTIDYDGAHVPVDTGFIVFNVENYPHLTALLQHLGVATIASDMSFAVSDPQGFEWSSNGIGGLFAWKRNAANPRYLGMLHDIVRFSTTARRDLEQNAVPDVSLEAYVARLNLGASFLKDYLLPMGAAIWSTPEDDMLRYPAQTFLRFFDNHRLLHARRPIWRTIAGGSRAYVEKIRAELGARAQCGDPVVAVRRSLAKAHVSLQSGREEAFDQVVLACHSNEALSLLGDADAHEKQLLGDIRYAPNTAYLHRDATLMPRRESAWASWNYMRHHGIGGDGVCVSYWMNLLQAVPKHMPLFVTLNPAKAPDPAKTFGQFSYDHPQFDEAAIKAQKTIQTRQGERRTWFAGAWLGYGFHEDGLASGLSVAEALGARLPWVVHARRDGVAAIAADRYTEAA
jgi:hypothetical protein